MEEKKDSTWSILIISLIILAIVVGVSYFLANQNKLKNDVKNTTDEVKDDIDNTKDKVEEDTKDIKENSYIGFYQGKLNDTYIEISLEKDNNAKIGIDNKEIYGTYEINDKIINVTSDQNTYQFVIAEDGTITYKKDNQNITLQKVDKSALKIIKKS